jgi:sugar-specific transcriptional regulator TrmB
MSKQSAQIAQTLSEFGINDNESQVLIALIQKGPQTILEISRSSNLPRSSLYYILPRLQNKKLVFLNLTDQSKKYQAVEPEELESLLIKSKQSSLQLAISQLKNVQNQTKETNQIKIYTGIDKLKVVYESLLLAEDKSEYLVKSGDYESWYNMDNVFFRNFEIRRGVIFDKVRVLLSPSQNVKADTIDKIKLVNMYAKKLPVNMPILTNMILVDGKMIVHELKPPFRCLVIENDFLYELEKQEFELIWNLLD